jgi:chromosomal replication initiator protein
LTGSQERCRDLSDDVSDATPPEAVRKPVPDELETIWDAVRRELRRDVTDFSFHIWLDPLEPVACEHGTLYVRAPEHIRSWVTDRYTTLLVGASQRAGIAAIELVDEGWAAVGAEPAARARELPERDGLNPKYTFEQFVIGDGNRLAHAASLAVAELPAQAWNPLFIHGPPGLGKTHLLHAIGNYVARYGEGLRVRYATVEEFTSEFVQAVRSRRTDVFRERFRDVDVLLLDDVQFLADKVRTKEELFHTFNALYESGRQLVITSDRSPVDLEAFEARLQERFECGLVAELTPPAADVRHAILRKRVSQDGLKDVPDETLEAVARLVGASVRVLEGALIRVVAYASLVDKPPTPELAMEVLGRLYRRRNAERSSIRRIQEATAAEFGIAPEALLARDRTPRVAFARQVAMYLARELTDEGLPALGREFGGRNHSTVLHAWKRVSQLVDKPGEKRETVASIRRRLELETGDDRVH